VEKEKYALSPRFHLGLFTFNPYGVAIFENVDILVRFEQHKNG
jgi:hypothetical protein